MKDKPKYIGNVPIDAKTGKDARPKKLPIIRLVYGKKSIKLSRKSSDMFWESAKKKNVPIEEVIKDFEKWLHAKIEKEGVDAFVREAIKNAK